MLESALADLGRFRRDNQRGELTRYGRVADSIPVGAPSRLCSERVWGSIPAASGILAHAAGGAETTV